jgi:hypothetical protein
MTLVDYLWSCEYMESNKKCNVPKYRQTYRNIVNHHFLQLLSNPALAKKKLFYRLVGSALKRIF